MARTAPKLTETQWKALDNTSHSGGIGIGEGGVPKRSTAVLERKGLTVNRYDDHRCMWLAEATIYGVRALAARAFARDAETAKLFVDSAIDWPVCTYEEHAAGYANTADVPRYEAECADDALRAKVPAGLLDAKPGLTILRLGLGRDSIAMVCLLIEDGLIVDGERITKENVHAVVFTDTGAEWTSTLALIPRMRELCDAHGLRLIIQCKPPREQYEAFLASRVVGVKGGQPWRATEPPTIEEKAATGWYHMRAPIMADYSSKTTIVAFSDPSCTSNHKIAPNRALINDLSMEHSGLSNRSYAAAVKRGARAPHRVLLGIAADEAQRAIKGGGPLYEANFYPLCEMGITKADEAPILERHGLNHVVKSGCVMCKFAPLSWYWALSVVEPERFADVWYYETIAVERNPNLYIFPKLKLPIDEAVAKWRADNPAATIEAVMRKDYKRCDAGGKPIRKKKTHRDESVQGELFKLRGPGRVTKAAA